MVLVTGGAASGKSALAEDYAVKLGGPLYYIAAMRPQGGEALRRIERHRALRAGKGFSTMECLRNLHELRLPISGGTALLEDVGNLLANEMFMEGVPPVELPERLLRGLEALLRQAGHVVAVTNEVFSGAERYDGKMRVYLARLGEANRRTALRADVVAEAVCGLPLILKGEGKLI